VPTLVKRKAPRSPPLSPASVRRLADAMLKTLALEHSELSVLLTDDRTIHALNRQHRDKDRPTDVLSFPLDEDADGPAEQRVLGDVVISLDTAQRQALGRRRDLLTEVRFLLAHGILHLIGHDHAYPAQKRRMTALTRHLVRQAPLPVSAPRSRSKRPSNRRR
jgi:probable rRNA maturation factor